MERTASGAVRDATSHVESSEHPGQPGLAGAPLSGGVIAGFAASICCIGPLVLVALGLGGAAAGLIALFTPLRPIFIGVALLFLGFAAYRLFYLPRVCAPGTACADPRTLRNQRLLFLGVAILVAALVAFPWYADYLV
jgi:mercuric ion transport protein